MIKKIFLGGFGLLVVILVALAIRFIFGGPEDSWICQNGSWVKHGNPSSPMPTNPCGNLLSDQNKNPIEKITYKNATTDNIAVDLPLPGAVVSKEFSIIGKARGTWFFEASFPVQVIDKDGNVLAAIPAQAQSDWMTTDFVPFKADIKIPTTYTGPATLILKKDNPSGLPEKDASIAFPITIAY